MGMHQRNRELTKKREGEKGGEQTKKLKKRGAYHEDDPLSFHLPYTHTRETCHEAIKIIQVLPTHEMHHSSAHMNELPLMFCNAKTP